MHPISLLPHPVTYSRGTVRDYRELEHFHYAARSPATWAGIWRASYRDRTIGVAVLSYPAPSLRARERALQLTGPRYGPRLAFLNRNLRTISRVVVHPQFRSLGIASELVRRVCDECAVRYVEAIAVMGEVHPFFERGGMTRIERVHAAEAAYFIFDRLQHAQREDKPCDVQIAKI